MCSARCLSLTSSRDGQRARWMSQDVAGPCWSVEALMKRFFMVFFFSAKIRKVVGLRVRCKLSCLCPRFPSDVTGVCKYVYIVIYINTVTCNKYMYVYIYIFVASFLDHPFKRSHKRYFFQPALMLLRWTTCYVTQQRDKKKGLSTPKENRLQTFHGRNHGRNAGICQVNL